MREKTESIKGYLKIKDIEYTFSLEGEDLYLFISHKYIGKDNNNLIYLESIREQSI